MIDDTGALHYDPVIFESVRSVPGFWHKQQEKTLH